MAPGKNLALVDDETERDGVIDEPAPGAADDTGGWYPSADEIFAIDDIASEVVAVPEWKDKGGRVPRVIVHSLDGEARDKYQNSLWYQDAKGRTKVDMREANARLLVLACKRLDGTPLFTRFDLDRLQKKNAAAIERLAKVARRLSGLDNEDDETDEKKRREGLD